MENYSKIVVKEIKKFVILPIVAIAILFGVACKPTHKSIKNSEMYNPLLTKECKQVKIVRDSVKFEWTGFKYSDKTPVTGKFREFNFKYKAEKKAVQAFQSVTFEINPQSLETGLQERNITLFNAFFKSMFKNDADGNPTALKGKVLELSHDKVTIEVNLWDKRTITLPYTMEGQVLKAEGVVNLLELGLQKEYEAISKSCIELHKGPDRKSVTWKEVNLSLQAQFLCL